MDRRRRDRPAGARAGTASAGVGGSGRRRKCTPAGPGPTRVVRWRCRSTRRRPGRVGSGHHSARSFHGPEIEVQDAERRVRQHVGEHVERDAEPLGDRLAVARVGHEQLQHARGLAQRGGALHRLRRVDRVDEPDAAVVRRARARRAAADRRSTQVTPSGCSASSLRRMGRASLPFVGGEVASHRTDSSNPAHRPGVRWRGVACLSDPLPRAPARPVLTRSEDRHAQGHRSHASPTTARRCSTASRSRSTTARAPRWSASTASARRR